MFLNCLAVGAGGFLGSIIRYLCGFIAPNSTFPYCTMAINVVGSFALAVFAGLLISETITDPRLSLFLRVGLCGGFTTFSTFSNETMVLLQQGRTVEAVLYALLSCVLCVAAAFAGDWAAGSFGVGR